MNIWARNGILALAAASAAGAAAAQSVPLPPAGQTQVLRPYRPAPAVLAIRPEYMFRKRLLVGAPMPQWRAVDLIRRAYPGAKVLRVRHDLRNGAFLVTLRRGSRLLRIRINRRTGAFGA